jgi:predicted acyltransferase (DUF342 family)
MEYYKPKDAGPLRIDMNRNIDERYFSQSFRKMVDIAIRNPEHAADPLPVDEDRFGGTEGRLIRARINRGEENIIELDGDVTIAPNTKVNEVLVVRGALKTGKNCFFEKEVLVEGDADFGSDNNLLCASAANMVVGENTDVEGWLDADGTIHLREGGRVMSRATAGKKLLIDGDVASPRFAAPEVDLGEVSRLAENYINPTDSIRAVKWTPAMDSYLSEKFETDSMDELHNAIRARFHVSAPEIVLLRRAVLLGLVDRSLFKMESKEKPAYMKNNSVWLQGGETARIKGNIEIPDGETVPFNLIVTGNLKSGEKVTFQGGVHVKGIAKIGRMNHMWRSLVCDRNIEMGDHSIVENCLDAEGDIVVHEDVKVGIGTDGGGMSAGGKITLGRGFEGHNKTFASEIVLSESAAEGAVA